MKTFILALELVSRNARAPFGKFGYMARHRRLVWRKEEITDISRLAEAVNEAQKFLRGYTGTNSAMIVLEVEPNVSVEVSPEEEDETGQETAEAEIAELREKLEVASAAVDERDARIVSLEATVAALTPKPPPVLSEIPGGVEVDPASIPEPPPLENADPEPVPEVEPPLTDADAQEQQDTPDEPVSESQPEQEEAPGEPEPDVSEPAPTEEAPKAEAPNTPGGRRRRLRRGGDDK